MPTPRLFTSLPIMPSRLSLGNMTRDHGLQRILRDSLLTDRKSVRSVLVTLCTATEHRGLHAHGTSEQGA